MKKIDKMSISPDKIMKNEDLINLQGGYGSSGCDPHASTCGGDSCTITLLDGSTRSGTCERTDVFNLCGCVQKIT